jgi:hypothetical protein
MQTPSTAAKVVIMIGRNRTRQASKIASSELRFCLRLAWRAKSVIIIAFFFTIPSNRMTPMIAVMSNCRRNGRRPINAQRNHKGPGIGLAVGSNRLNILKSLGNHINPGSARKEKERKRSA